MKRIKTINKKYKVAGIFSGIGGFELGFIHAGFNVVWANDFDKYSVETYRKNIGEHIVLGDIRKINNIPRHDVLIGGFPCQPFSTLGKLEGFKDKERGNLFFIIKKLIKKNKTKVIVLENVKNLIHHDNKKTFRRILNELNDLGYDCYYQILNTADFGIPQRRNRVFIVGFLRSSFKKDIFNFPNKMPLKLSTQDLLDKNVDERYFLSKKISKTILGRGTKGYIVNPTIDLPISKTLTATMHKMHRASQDNYITDNINREKFKSDTKINIRKLTPNECRKLQGFPNDWQQVVSDTQAFKQFGNAVTVDVSYYLAREIMKYLDKNLKK